MTLFFNFVTVFDFYSCFHGSDSAYADVKAWLAAAEESAGVLLTDILRQPLIRVCVNHLNNVSGLPSALKLRDLARLLC